MQSREIGTSGLVSSAVGFGTTALTGAYGYLSTRKRTALIRFALETGVTMFDVADFHADGNVERLLAASLSERRADALIATQGGMRTAAGRTLGIDGSPEYLAMACDASLRRLRTDYIDLFYLSGIDPRVPLDESVGKLAELVAAGKIRHIGLREPSIEQLRRAHAIHAISAVSLEYSLCRQLAERRLLLAATELGVGVVACTPLGRGLLTGRRPAWASPKEKTAMRAVESVAGKLDVGVARLALAWLLARRGDVVPVPSTHNLIHLEMNSSAAEVALDDDTCALLADEFRQGSQK
jgi:aryl-alcohol dehydrogenase-like predicted oxidoreductase